MDPLTKTLHVLPIVLTQLLLLTGMLNFTLLIDGLKLVLIFKKVAVLVMVYYLPVKTKLTLLPVLGLVKLVQVNVLTVT